MPARLSRQGSNQILAESALSAESPNVEQQKKLKRLPYASLLTKTLTALNAKNKKATPYSFPAICNYVQNNYQVNEKTFKQYLKRAIKDALRAKSVLQVKRSYVLSPKKRQSKKNIAVRKTIDKRTKIVKIGKAKAAVAPAPIVPKAVIATTPFVPIPSSVFGTPIFPQAPPIVPTPSPVAHHVSNSVPVLSAPLFNFEYALFPRCPSCLGWGKDLVQAHGLCNHCYLKQAAPSRVARAQIAAVPNAIVLPSADAPKFDHIWQYYHNGWMNYNTKSSDVVEQVYQNYLANRGDTDVRAVKSGEWEYQVDFMAMKQTNIQHSNHTVREIRRVPITKN